jgi:hypothetical protein
VRSTELGEGYVLGSREAVEMSRRMVEFLGRVWELSVVGAGVVRMRRVVVVRRAPSRRLFFC